MRLFYLSYWGVADSLTHATVLPHLAVLHASTQIERVVFASVERDDPGRFEPSFAPERLRYVGLRSRSFGPAFVARALDFVDLPSRIAKLCREERVTHVLARGAPAGALAHLLQRHLALPYFVESFEPHAAYMLESGVWRSWDPRYVFQRRWEEAQKQEAVALLPVAEGYRDALIREGVLPEKIITLPCTVDTQRFRFSPSARTRVRHKLGMEESFVGIYVGKFGGVYYAAEAFQVFAAFAGRMPAFRMVVLSPMPASDVRRLARTAGFPEDRLVVTAVSHAEVPDYLSAADVGFATYRIAPAHRFLSPVKVGEYWASGLPTVITEGTGDDSAIVEAHDAGAVVSLTPNSEAAAVTQIVNIVGDPDHRDRIASLAARFRSRERIRDAYHDLGFL